MSTSFLIRESPMPWDISEDAAAQVLSSSLDNYTLCYGTARDLVKYFTKELQRTPAEDMCAQVFYGINSGAIPPTVVHIFLSVCKDPFVIVYALSQKASSLGRQVAINHLRRWFRSRRFGDMWKALGDIQGLLDIMKDLPITDVRLLCRRLGECSYMDGSAESVARRSTFSKLYNSLCGLDPTGPRNHEIRPLRYYYNTILPAYESRIIFELVSRGLQFKGRWYIFGVPSRDQFLKAIFPGDGKGVKITPYVFALECNDVEFSIDVLEKIAQSPAHLVANALNLFQDLIRPLASRLYNRRESAHVQLKFYRLVLECIDLEASITSAFDDSIIIYAIEAWNRNCHEQASLENCLIKLMSVIDNDHQWQFEMVSDALRHVRPHRRFLLLRLLFRNIPPFRVDIGTLENPNDKGLKSDFIVNDNIDCTQVITQSSCGPYEFIDHEVLNAFFYSKRLVNGLIGLDMGWQLFCTLRRRKHMAECATNAEERVDWVAKAIRQCIASGSLHIYDSTLQWVARQFTQDAQTVAGLFSSRVICTKESRLETDVRLGNRILAWCVLMLHRYLEGPAFDLTIAQQYLALPMKVVQRRIKALDDLQKRINLPNCKVYKAVWEDTIATLLTIERFGLKQGHESLHFHKLGGPLELWTFPTNPRSHVYKFVDELAKNRDRLWQLYRFQVNPETASLTTPWPRGLPIQYLAPAALKTPRNMSYLELRAKSIVFAPREDLICLIPSEEAIRVAIGPFVDSYHYALRIFVLAADNARKQERRALNAWNHASINLKRWPWDSIKGNRWNWNRVFLATPDIPFSKHPAIDNSSIMSAVDDESGTSVRLDPRLRFRGFPPVTASSPGIKLSSKYCLDSMMMPYSTIARSFTVHSPFRPNISKLDVVSVERRTHIWNLQSCTHMLPPKAKSELIIATIALLDAKYGLDSSLFAQPFPSAEEPRFPRLYLDQEFLQKCGKYIRLDSVLHPLKVLPDLIPSGLSKKLLMSLWNRLNDNSKGKERVDKGEVLHIIMTVLKAFAQGDHPENACSHILDRILRCRDDISLQTRLISDHLNKNLLNRLSPTVASDCLRGLAIAAKNEFRLQQRRKTSRKKDKPSRISPTAARLIVRLLGQAMYLSPQDTCDILKGLFTNTTQADIRIQVVRSLLNTRAKVSGMGFGPELAVDNILKDYVTPAAASINGNESLTEKEWKKLRDEGAIPEIYECELTNDSPPMMQLLVDEISRMPATESRKRYVKRVIIPLMNLSSTIHSRWMTMFISFNKFPRSILHELPPMPLFPKVLLNLLADYPQFFGDVNTFGRIGRLTILSIDPPLSISRITKEVKNSFELRNSNAGKHWLSIWTPLSLGVSYSADLLLSGDVSKCTELGLRGIQPISLRNLVVDVSKIYISNRDIDGYFAFLEGVAFSFGLPLSTETSVLFKTAFMPLFAQFIHAILEPRSSDWYKGSNKRDFIRPLTFGVQLHILRARLRCQSPLVLPTERIQELVHHSTKLMKYITDNGDYMYEWEEMKQALLQYFDKKDYISLAIAFGSLEDVEARNLNEVDYLRFELAKDFILEAEVAYPDDNEELDKFLTHWLNSLD
ncbi:hypothetical protein M426DRAFT_265415 [Hypoxylon sp. CI-4A]|nr:hypothetical protein M426DRAFT_265415 [Hypoxylon sp. CI-4A]